ncbi:uncharacterized protein BDW43DRAFT_315403 [Aspergillus alliaceus]|uniref:uncharacterized protein n=1 Tax=Petromyces alliaceus TaxID=209559 RepID=UPI0012A4B647|nr:uncharacterized protein BDW43DRAFT_315403 [Aspergillus alliaceus]KAB8228902.1 hypothetical protein BDW43DRAFT_315403 [Aspergillus alliaceus]
MNSVTARSLYRPLEWEVAPDMLPVCSVCIQDNDIAELLESLHYSLPYSFLILNPLEFPDPIGEPLEPPVAEACDTNRRLSLNTGKTNQPEELSPEDLLKRCRETPKKLYDDILECFYALMAKESSYLKETASLKKSQNPQNPQNPTGSAARIPEIEKELTNTIGQLTVKNYQIAQLGEEQDSYRNAFTAQQLNRRESGTNSRQGSLQPESKGKSEKVPDPPVLTYGKNPKFEDWLAEIVTNLKPTRTGMTLKL